MANISEAGVTGGVLQQMDDGSQNWKNDVVLRQQTRQKLEQVVSQSENPTSKNSMQLENHVFNKAQSKTEYVSLIGRLIGHLSAQKKKAGGIPATLEQQDTIHALQRSASVDNRHIQQHQNFMRAMPQQQQQQQQPQQQMQLQPQPGGGGAASAAVQQHPMMGGQPGAGAGGMRGMMMPQQMSHQTAAMNQMPPQQHARLAFIQQQQRMQILQQQMQQQQQGQRQTVINPGEHIRQQRIFAGDPPGYLGNVAHNIEQIPPGHAMMMRGTGVPPGAAPAAAAMHQMVGGQTAVSHPHGSPLQYQMHAASPNAAPVPSSGPGVGMMPSPQDPGQQHAAATTPGTGMTAAGMMRRMMVPSPNASINTPVSGMITSPGEPPANTIPSKTPGLHGEADQAYMEKLRQMSRYVEPLRKYIQRYEKEAAEYKVENNKLNKTRTLLEILSNPQYKKLTFEALVKCELFLHQLFAGTETEKSPTAGGAATTALRPEQQIIQPILDALHNKHRKAASVLDVTANSVCAETIRGPSPEPWDDNEEEVQKKSGLPDVLQGEIARLPARFHLKLDNIASGNVKNHNISFTCTLKDKKLPAVPPIHVVIPEKYPYASPICKDAAKLRKSADFEKSSELRAMWRILSESLQSLPDKYSLTQLLNAWELSVRQACGASYTPLSFF